jgi:hypothetical protein
LPGLASGSGVRAGTLGCDWGRAGCDVVVVSDGVGLSASSRITGVGIWADDLDSGQRTVSHVSYVGLDLLKIFTRGNSPARTFYLVFQTFNGNSRFCVNTVRNHPYSSRNAQRNLSATYSTPHASPRLISRIRTKTRPG